MKLRFAKLNPTENMTVIVLSPISREQQAGIARKLMAYGSVFAEQVGFLEAASLPGACARLQMMGGEFCGNASMSMAAWLAAQDELPDGGETVYPLEVSGAEGLVHCRIRRDGGSFLGTVSMPVPEKITEMEVAPGMKVPLVCFPGIVHAIVPEGAMTAQEAQTAVPAWCAELGADAMGILLAGGDMTRIRPLVYVRETGSAVWERGCGSGTAAVGAWTAMQAGAEAELDVSQPGGTIHVHALCREGRVQEIRITGRVYISVAGEAYIE